MPKTSKIQGILHEISRQPKKRLTLFRGLDVTEQREVIQQVSKHAQRDILASLKSEELLSLLQHLDMDCAMDLLQLLDGKRQMKLMKMLGEQMQTDISLLLNFDPDTAAGLMSIDYIQVKPTDTIAMTAKRVKVHEKRTGKLPSILVSEAGKLQGYVTGYSLGAGKPTDKVRKYIQKIKTIPHHADTEEVMDMFERHPHSKMVVLGEYGNVMGIIYTDDILRTLRAREASSLYDFAGLRKEETIYDSMRYKVQSRYKWLIINLGTAFIAALTVGLFDETISKYVLLAVYMPIVAGMGGNAATQTLAVMVRGISLKQLDARTVWRTLKNELGAGLVNGIINGLIITGIVMFKDGDMRIALILASAMVINMLIAAFFGTLVPLVMKRLGKDPAASATIFITTATDVFGFLAFLGLATLLLR